MKRPKRKRRLTDHPSQSSDTKEDYPATVTDDETDEDEGDESMEGSDDRKYEGNEEIEIVEDSESTEKLEGILETVGSAAAVAPSEPASYSPELDLELIPEPGRSAYFEPHENESTENESNNQDNSLHEDEELQDEDAPEMEAEWAKVEADDGNDSREEEAGADQKASPNLTVETMVVDVRKIVSRTLERGMEELGEYLLKNVFDNDIAKVFSKNPYKGNSFSELARHPQNPLSRQRMAEAVRAAALGPDMEAMGIPRAALPFTHKIHIAGIKDRTIRNEIVQMAHQGGWTVETTKKEIQKRLGTASSEDQRLGRTLLRQMGELVKVYTDKETKSFLKDKDRLKAALPRSARLQMIGSSAEFRKHLRESVGMLESLENDLADIELEARKTAEEDDGHTER